MKWKIQSALALALLLVPLGLFPAVRADYNLQIKGDTLSVAWTVNAYQNLSAYKQHPVFPMNLNASLVGRDLSAFASALQNSIEKKVGSTSISNLNVHVSSNSPNLTCTLGCAPQWLNVTTTFQVHEASQTSSGILQYDLSWKGILLDQDLQAGNVSFNRVGEKYLVNALTPFTNFQNSAKDSMNVVVNNQGVQKATYQGAASSIVLFDMSKLLTPVDSWRHTSDFVSQRDSWTSLQSGGFSASAIETVTELGESTHINYLSGATVNAEISTPFNTLARGDLLLVDVSGGFVDQVFVVVILVSLGVLAGTLIIERRITTSSRRAVKPIRKAKRG